MNKLILALVLSVVVLGGGYFLIVQQQGPETAPAAMLNVVISASATPPSGLVIIANEQGFFTEQGLKVTWNKYSSGKASLNAVLQGEADIGATSENPIMHAVMRGEKVRLLSSILSTGHNYVVVGRRDRGITKIADLKGKMIGVTRGTNAEFLLEALLTVNRIALDEVDVVNILPTEIVAAINEGRVDAISSWNPHVLLSQKALKENAVSFYSPELYTATFNLAAMDAFVNANAEIIERVLRALVRAEKFVGANPEQARKLMALHMRLSEDMLSELWDIYNFDVTIDQSLITTMESQAHWAIRKKMTDRVLVPNFLDTLYLDGLNTIAPGAVTVIQ